MDYQAFMDLVNNHKDFTYYVGFKVTKMELGEAVIEMDVEDKHLNLKGFVHGGVFYTIADTVAASATWSNGFRWVTLDSSFYFHSNVNSGHIRAVGKIVSCTRTVCVSEARIYSEDNTLLASGCFTFHCLNPLPKEEKA